MSDVAFVNPFIPSSCKMLTKLKLKYPVKSPSIAVSIANAVEASRISATVDPIPIRSIVQIDESIAHAPETNH